MKFFRENDFPKLTKTCVDLLKELETFSPKIPLILTLTQKGMRERHWLQIQAIVYFEMSQLKDYNVERFIQLGALDHVEQIVMIGDRAEKEYKIERMLKEIEAQWEYINFLLV